MRAKVELVAMDARGLYECPECFRSFDAFHALVQHALRLHAFAVERNPASLADAVAVERNANGTYRCPEPACVYEDARWWSVQGHAEQAHRLVIVRARSKDIVKKVDAKANVYLERGLDRMYRCPKHDCSYATGEWKYMKQHAKKRHELKVALTSQAPKRDHGQEARQQRVERMLEALANNEKAAKNQMLSPTMEVVNLDFPTIPAREWSSPVATIESPLRSPASEVKENLPSDLTSEKTPLAAQEERASTLVASATQSPVVAPLTLVPEPPVPVPPTSTTVVSPTSATVSQTVEAPLAEAVESPALAPLSPNLSRQESTTVSPAKTSEAPLVAPHDLVIEATTNSPVSTLSVPQTLTHELPTLILTEVPQTPANEFPTLTAAESKELPQTSADEFPALTSVQPPEVLETLVDEPSILTPAQTTSTSVNELPTLFTPQPTSALELSATEQSAVVQPSSGPKDSLTPESKPLASQIPETASSAEEVPSMKEQTSLVNHEIISPMKDLPVQEQEVASPPKMTISSPVAVQKTSVAIKRLLSPEKPPTPKKSFSVSSLLVSEYAPDPTQELPSTEASTLPTAPSEHEVKEVPSTTTESPMRLLSSLSPHQNLPANVSSPNKIPLPPANVSLSTSSPPTVAAQPFPTPTNPAPTPTNPAPTILEEPSRQATPESIISPKIVSVPAMVSKSPSPFTKPQSPASKKAAVSFFSVDLPTPTQLNPPQTQAPTPSAMAFSPTSPVNHGVNDSQYAADNSDDSDELTLSEIGASAFHKMRRSTRPTPPRRSSVTHVAASPNIDYSDSESPRRARAARRSLPLNTAISSAESSPIRSTESPQPSPPETQNGFTVEMFECPENSCNFKITDFTQFQTHCLQLHGFHVALRKEDLPPSPAPPPKPKPRQLPASKLSGKSKKRKKIPDSPPTSPEFRPASKQKRTIVESPPSSPVVKSNRGRKKKVVQSPPSSPEVEIFRPVIAVAKQATGFLCPAPNCNYKPASSISKLQSHCKAKHPFDVKRGEEIPPLVLPKRAAGIRRRKEIPNSLYVNAIKIDSGDDPRTFLQIVRTIKPDNEIIVNIK